jgi:hypothetical protein
MHYLALNLPNVNGGSTAFKINGVPTGGSGELAGIISAGIVLMILAAIFICLFMLILSGFEWIFSQGDKQKIANARQRIAMSILGLVLIFCSFLIINVLDTFFFGHAINFLSTQQP